MFFCSDSVLCELLYVGQIRFSLLQLKCVDPRLLNYILEWDKLCDTILYDMIAEFNVD